MATFTVILTITGLCALVPVDGDFLAVYAVKTDAANCSGQTNKHMASLSYYSHHDLEVVETTSMDPRGSQVISRDLSKWMPEGDELLSLSLHDATGELTGGVDISAGIDWLGGQKEPNFLNRESFRWICSAKDLGKIPAVVETAANVKFLIKKGRLRTGGIYRKESGDYLRYEFKKGKDQPTQHTQALASYATIEIKGLSEYLKIIDGSGLSRAKLTPRWDGDVIEIGIGNLPKHEAKQHKKGLAKKMQDPTFECNYDFSYFDCLFGACPKGGRQCLVPCWPDEEQGAGDRLCPLIKG